MCKHENCDHSCGHSRECRYNDDDKLLYVIMMIRDHKALISANEAVLFDDLLREAHNGDKNIVEHEPDESCPYKLVYGGIMCLKDATDFDEVKKNLDRNKGCAFTTVDDFDGKNLPLSTIEDYYIEDNNDSVYRPFVALMQTDTTLHDIETSVTFLPRTNRLVWEDIVNKQFLIAARETVEIENLTTDNWQQHIDKDLLVKYYMIADKYIPKE